MTLVHSGASASIPTDDAERVVLVNQLKARRNDDPLFLYAARALSWIPWNDREALRRIVSDLSDEIAAAERGKATTRASRKQCAKAFAVNQILAIRQTTTAVEGPSVGIPASCRDEPKNIPANGDSQ